jgi:DNA (cytosine-5)-methyltransferase 1
LQVKPRLLDLFCGAGGAAMGYHLAGFNVVGVDVEPQPHYPFEFTQDDALALLSTFTASIQGWWDEPPFQAIHASPPCEAYSQTQRIRHREHPDLIGPTRDLLNLTGLPYVIENVPGAPLRNPVVLEGQMFEGLRTQRTRWFETNWPLDVPFLRSPRPAPLAKMGRPARPHEWLHIVGNFHGAQSGRDAMGIDWMNRNELAQAIPPAYTQLIGRQLLNHLNAQRAPVTVPPVPTLPTRTKT